MRVCADPLEPSRQPARKKEFFGILEVERSDRKILSCNYLGHLPGVDHHVPQEEPAKEDRGGHCPGDPGVVLPQSNMFDEMGDQLIDFEGQRKKDSQSDDQPPRRGR